VAERSPLEVLASDGLRGLPVSDFGAVVEESAASARATGDARYTTLADLFGSLQEWWSDHDEMGGIPSPLAAEIDSLIVSRLPEVLRAASAAEGYAMAAGLASEVRRLMTGPNDWIKRGYLRSRPPA
jgi:hypothetical protein